MRQSGLMAVGAMILSACSAASGVHDPSGGSPPSSTVEVQILAFNDFHGNLEPPVGGLKRGSGRVSAGGASYFAAHLAARRAENPHTVVVSAGDLIGASPLVSALFHDEPTIEAMDAMGLDINGVGNHEFDEGLAELRRMKDGGCHPEDGCREGYRFDGAKFAMLAANAIDVRTGERVFPPYEVREMGGVSVGFIGLTLEGTRQIVPPVIPELRFRDEADTVNLLVQKLRTAGVHAIVVLVHEGGFATGGYDGCGGISGPIVDIVQRFDTAVDIVISGHTHRAYNCRINEMTVTSAGAFGRILTDLDVTLSTETHDVISVRAKNHVVTHDLDEVSSVAALVARYVDLAAPQAKRVVGELSGPLPRDVDETGQAPLGRVIADAQLEATRGLGAQIAFMNPGGIRVGLEGPGPVTYEDIFRAQPFGNRLVTLSLTGKEIIDALEAQWRPGGPRFLQVSSTFRYAWDKNATNGARVRAEWVYVDGAPLEIAREYRVTVNSYMAELGVFKRGRKRDVGMRDLDALEAFLARHRPLSRPRLDRIRRK